MTRSARLAAPALASLLALGCGDSGFEPPSLVTGPRVLAVIVEPPEARPGEDVTFTAITAAPNDEALTIEWTIDLSTAALAAGAGQTLGEAGEPIVLEDGALPGEATARAADALLALVAGAPPGTPEHVTLLVYEQVGLPIVARVAARDASGSIVVEGFKRFFLTPREDVTTNPPPPRFSVAGRWVSARSGDPLVCAPEGEPPVVIAGEVAALSPDEDEPWLETYPALDIQGELVENHEAAFYSWHSTAGDFSFAVTRAPDRAVEWTAPDEPGDYPIWLVVRDGHLGTSGCRASVRVTRP